MNCTYELRHDLDGIARMQQATLENPYSLKVTHGLIGSPEWWQHIENGSLRTQRQVGIVSNFWPGQGKAGPAEFELRTPDGAISNWPCEMQPLAAEKAFTSNREVMVDFVVQELKVPFAGTSETKIPLSIWLNLAQPNAQADAATPRG